MPLEFGGHLCPHLGGHDELIGRDDGEWHEGTSPRPKPTESHVVIIVSVGSAVGRSTTRRSPGLQWIRARHKATLEGRPVDRPRGPRWGGMATAAGMFPAAVRKPSPVMAMKLLPTAVVAGHRWSGIEQIDQGHRAVTVRTWTARSNPATELLAVGAALLAEQAGATGRTLVDGRRAGCPAGQGRQRGRVPLAPAGLAAGGGAEALAPSRGEYPATARAGDRYAIITEREFSHGRPPWAISRLRGGAGKRPAWRKHAMR